MNQHDITKLFLNDTQKVWNMTLYSPQHKTGNVIDCIADPVIVTVLFWKNSLRFLSGF